eukprot:TRINITY_DN694_c3_g6_i2.p1 TRINITY_DN694_c3_g6~~TRINITY_DN694_c3_g6_i2.p1  ORF type:complete len:693 (-),score=167.02 TRINITY_DN694_c3_g6_i2:89-2140(-)
MAKRKKLLEDFKDLTSELTDCECELDDENLFLSLGEDFYTLNLGQYPEVVKVIGPHGETTTSGKLVDIVKDMLDGGLVDDQIAQEEISEDDELRYLKNETLMNEVANLVTLHKVKVNFRPMTLLDLVEVEILVDPLLLLDHHTSSAWGIDSSVPIAIKIHISDVYYLESSKVPELEIFQKVDDKYKTFGLKYQLEGILRTFVSKHWPSKSNKPIKIKHLLVEKETSTVSTDKKRKNSSSSSSSSSGETSHSSSKRRKSVESGGGGSDDLPRLISMGFGKTKSENALKMSDSFEEALQLLLDNPDLCNTKSKSPSNTNKSKSSKTTTTTTTTTSSSPKKSKTIIDLFEDPDVSIQNQTEEEKLNVPSDYGLLEMIVSYLKKRIKSLNDFCVICDQPHVFATGSMLKPAVCARELCCWSFQQLKVGANGADEIAVESQVVDLLVCMACVAAKSQRKNLIFEPFPTVFDLNDQKTKVLDPVKKNFDLVERLLDKMPSVSSMTQAKDFSSMKKKIDDADVYCYPLLQWIISSNRAHIVQLQEKKRLFSMNTSFQYLLLSAPPEKEQKFQELKKSHGTSFAFHGSGIENWHSILRRGLVNASGTNLQVNGAAYGSGIYLSPAASTSFGYSRLNSYASPNQVKNNNNNNNKFNELFLNKDNLYCIAVCEGNFDFIHYVSIISMLYIWRL